MRRPWTWSMDFVARLPMSQARLRDISVAQTLGTITFAIYDSAEPRPRFIIILVGQRFAFHAWIFRRLLARSAPHEASFFNIFPSSFLPIERGEVSLSYFRFWPKTSSILCWVCDVVTSWVHFLLALIYAKCELCCTHIRSLDIFVSARCRVNGFSIWRRQRKYIN